MTLRLGKLSDDARYEAWTRIVERIYEEHVNQGWSHYMFRLLRAVFATNQKLSDEGGFVFDWMAANYVDATLMLLRRELDQQAGTENLRNLLCDMIKHPTVMTRARYLSKWGQERSFDQELANLMFNRFSPRRVAGDAGSDHIDPDRIRADLDRVVVSTKRLGKYAEQTRAHRTPDQKVDRRDVTFDAIHSAIADVRAVVAKYYALLTLSAIAGWEPRAQYDTIEAFTWPWVVDRTAVEQAAKKASKQ